MPPEQPVEQQRGVEVGALRDPLQHVVPGQHRIPPAAPETVEAEPGGDREEQARGVLAREPIPMAQQLHEDVVGGVQGLILVPQQKPAAAEDHRPVALVERFDIDSGGLHPHRL